MNAFQSKRREELGQLLGDPERSYSELLESISRLVEREVRSAYGRGYRDAQQKAGQNRSRPRGGRQ